MANVKSVKSTKSSAKLPKISVKEYKKIVFLGSEAAPFIATGGLADVLGSLPKELEKKDNLDISVILPLYGNISDEFKKNFRFLTNFYVSVGWRSQYAGIFFYEYEKVKFYFIDNEYYFKREGNIYGFYDDGERFAFFSRAALDTIARLNIYPDVLNCNDWQTGLVPALLDHRPVLEEGDRGLDILHPFLLRIQIPEIFQYYGQHQGQFSH